MIKLSVKTKKRKENVSGKSKHAVSTQNSTVFFLSNPYKFLQVLLYWTAWDALLASYPINISYRKDQ